MKKLKVDRKIICDGVLLTATSLALKTAGVMFSSRLASIAGAEAMGLSSQISAVYAFAVTAAAAGVNLGAMRLTSESRGSGNENEIRAGISCALSYCAKTGTIVGLLLFILTPFLAERLIGTGQCILPLRILAVAVPFISASGAFHGYFNGVRRVYKSALVNVIEQIVRISLTLAGLYGISGTAPDNNIISNAAGALSDIAYRAVIKLSVAGVQISGNTISSGITTFSTTELACLAVVLGSVISELCSCLLLTILYLIDRRRYSTLPPSENRAAKLNLRGKFLHITGPMAVSAIIRTGLSSAEHLLLPRGLRAYGSTNALAEYGIICGMALPVVLYPMALVSSFAQLNTVDISTRASSGESYRQLKNRISGGLTLTLIYSIGCAAVLKAFAYPLGGSVFNSGAAGRYISALSAFAVLSYLDHIADSMLKGIDQQGYVMRINILDAAMGVTCAIVLVPKFGATGYIVSLYLCEFLNCLCSLGRLVSVTGAFPDPLTGIAIPTLTGILTVKLFSVSKIWAYPTVIALLTVAAVYLFTTLIFNYTIKYAFKKARHQTPIKRAEASPQTLGYRSDIGAQTAKID